LNIDITGLSTRKEDDSSTFGEEKPMFKDIKERLAGLQKRFGALRGPL
jgi:hypothetical protein